MMTSGALIFAGNPLVSHVHLHTICAVFFSSSELHRRCEESDAAGEEPNRSSEEQTEANSESGQSAPGEEAFPFLQHTHTHKLTHTHHTCTV